MSEANSRHRATEPAKPAIGQASSESAAPPASKAPATAKPLVDVDAVLFRAANECRCHEEVRYYLNGVYVHPHPDKGVLMVGTDGHRMMVVYDESGICKKPVIVQVDSKPLAGVKVPKDTDQPRARLTLSADKHVVIGTYRSLAPAIIESAFPDYARVLKPILGPIRKREFEPASFNAEYLASFAKIGNIMKPGRRAVRLVSTGEMDAALVLFADSMEAFGVLMPMRTSITNGFPVWMKPVLEAARPKRAAKKSAKAKPATRTKASKRKGRAR